MSNNNIVVISDKAADEIKKVVNWCGKIAIDLKSRFIEELDYFFSRISNMPYAYKVVDKDVHRCLMKIFPYINVSFGCYRPKIFGNLSRKV